MTVSTCAPNPVANCEYPPRRFTLVVEGKKFVRITASFSSMSAMESLLFQPPTGAGRDFAVALGFATLGRRIARTLFAIAGIWQIFPPYQHARGARIHRKGLASAIVCFRQVALLNVISVISLG